MYGRGKGRGGDKKEQHVYRMKRRLQMTRSDIEQETRKRSESNKSPPSGLKKLIFSSKKQYTVKCVENLLHRQYFQMNVCEIKYLHALLNALNTHG